MTAAGWTATAVVAGVFGFLCLNRLPPHVVLLSGLMVLLVSGILTPEAALAGFSNPGLATVAVLFVVAAGLRQTGALTFFVQRALGRPRSATHAQLRLAGPVLGGSAFLNNTPVVAMLLPVILDWCKASRISPSKLLLPLSYLAVLGGLCTLIGTSTNLVVNGMLTATGHPSLGLFDLAWVGIPCALTGVAWVLLGSHLLLPERATQGPVHHDPREYTVEMVVADRGPLVGQTIEQAGLRHLPGLFLVEIHRGKGLVPIVGPGETLQAGDQLVFAGVVDSVVDLQRIPGLVPATQQVFKLDAHRAQRVFVEAVVSRSSPMVGRSIRGGRFRTRYNAVVLAVSRHGERLGGRLGDIHLRAGDTLLLEALPSFDDMHRNSSDFLLVSRLAGSGPPTTDRAPVALAILAGMVALVLAGACSMLQAGVLAAAAMIVTRCCSEARARQSLDGPLLLTIGASFALGRALEDTGAAATLSRALLDYAGPDPWWALVVIYGTTTVLSNLVTNNAAAVIVFPVALATATELGANLTPFVIAVMIAASASFATPLGYQTHLMVYGPGGYRASDFLKMGLPLNLLLWAVTCLLTPLLWPL